MPGLLSTLDFPVLLTKPSEVLPGFARYYAFGNGLRVRTVQGDKDVVLDRTLEGFVQVPVSVIRYSDTVLQALEKTQAYMSILTARLIEIEDLLISLVPGGTTYGEPIVIPFNNTPTPSIHDYDRDYAWIYGQFPTVMLITVNKDENDQDVEVIRLVEPKRNKLLGVLDSIVWDLGEEVTGYIVLKK